MTTTIPAYAAPQRTTLARVTRAEWTKLRTQPSARWALGTAAVGVVAFGVLYSLLIVTRPHGGTVDAVGTSLAGVGLAQLAVGVLGVLAITNEYASGLIRTTLAAVPRRLPLLWAKAAVVAAASLAACGPAVVVAFMVGQSVLSREGLDTTIGAPGVARAVLGSALYLAAVALLGLGLGTLLRSTAAAVGALLGALIGLQLLSGFLPSSWSDHVYKYLPTPAGTAVTLLHPDPVSSLPPWTGFGVFLAYTAAVLGAAALRMRRGDA